jgi:hypothetical protein
MPIGHGRDDYTLEKMLERRKRNNIRKVLECNGRRLTAKVLFFRGDSSFGPCTFLKKIQFDP